MSLTLCFPMALYKMEVDLIGPMPTEKEGIKFAIVAVDYFNKWIEVEPLTKISEQKTTDLIWMSIVCQFGIPHSIVTDHGK